MAIDDVKQSIIENVTNAYNTVDAKGGAITGAKNLENLSDSIDSIVTGTVIGYHVRSVINDDGETQTLKISAGKLPEGELSITENGRYDVADYAEAVVAVPSEEPVLIDKTITENGEYSASADGADGYSNVSVDIPSQAGNPIEVATDTDMTNALTQDNVGKVYKFTGTSDTYETNAIYIIEEI